MTVLCLAALALPILQGAAPATDAAGDGSHARLHPASATLFFEMRDVQGTLAGYEHAALARTWNDADLRAAVQKLVPADMEVMGQSFGGEWDAAKLDQDVLAEGSWPLSVGPLALASQVQTVSISMRLPELPLPGVVPPAPALLAARVGLQVVLELSEPERAAELARALAAFAQEDGGGGPLADDFDPTQPFLWKQNEGLAMLGLVAWSRADGNRLVWSFGDVEFQDGAYRARGGTGEVPRFADRSDVAAARAVLGAGAGRTVFEGWQRESPFESLLAFAPLLSSLSDEEVIPAEVAESLANLSGAGTSLLSVFLGPTGTGAFRTLLAPAGFTGQFAGPVPPGERWYGGQPVPSAALEQVPPGATALWSAHVHGPSASAALRALLAKHLPEGASAIAALEEDGSFELERDLFAHLGTDAVLFFEPLSGIGVPGALLSIAVRDEAAVGAALTRLLGSLAEANPGSLAFRERPYRRLPYFELSAVGSLAESMPLDTELALGLAQGRLIVSLPMGQAGVVAKRELRRLVARAEAAAPATDATAEAAAQPATFDTAVLGLAKTDETIWYLDWPGAIGGLYGTAKALSGMASGFLGDELPVDLTALPEPELVVRHLRPTTIRTWVQGDYALRTVTSGFGPEVPTALFAGMAVLGSSNSRERSQRAVEMEPEEAEPTEEEATARAEEDTRRALQRVRSGLGVWSAFHDGRYPETLDALTEASELLPNGVFNGEPLPVDGWGQSLGYRVQEGGYGLWSVGANGEDEGGAGDDVRL